MALPEDSGGLGRGGGEIELALFHLTRRLVRRCLPRRSAGEVSFQVERGEWIGRRGERRIETMGERDWDFGVSGEEINTSMCVCVFRPILKHSRKGSQSKCRPRWNLWNAANRAELLGRLGWLLFKIAVTNYAYYEEKMIIMVINRPQGSMMYYPRVTFEFWISMSHLKGWSKVTPAYGGVPLDVRSGLRPIKYCVGYIFNEITTVGHEYLSNNASV